MIARIIYVTISLLGLYQRIYAQEENFRAATPASPQAQSFTRYGEIPVSLNTGVPNISIPLFTIQQYNLQHPVELRYHAGGHKVMDIGSNVGLGWNLNAGGVVSRTRRGVIDEANLVGYFQVAHKLNAKGFQWNGIDTPEDFFAQNPEIPLYADVEPDVFSVSVGSYQFKFQFDINHKIITDAPDSVKIEYLGYTFTPTQLGGEWEDYQHQYIPGWKITTPDGIKYFFEEVELIQSRPVGMVGVDTLRTLSETINAAKNYSSAWYLTKIEAPTGEQILFVYEKHLTKNMYIAESNLRGLHFIVDSTQTFEEALRQQPDTIQGKSNNSYDSLSWNSVHAYVPILKRIQTFPENTSVFFKNSDVDFLYFNRYGYDPKALGAIEIKNYRNHETHYIKFYHSHKLNRLTLDSLVIRQHVTSGVNNTYRFVYDERPLPDPQSVAMDHWGYYNANGETYEFIPTLRWRYTYYKQVTILGTNRESNPAVMQVGILKKMIYPTGGFSTFEYEPHTFTIPGTSKTYTGGGLRIKRITSKTNPADTNPVVKVFDYTKEVDGKNVTTGSTSTFPSEDVYKANITVYSHAARLTFDDTPKPVTSKIIQYYSNLSMPPMMELGQTSGSYIDYAQVTTKHGQNGENGKTVSRFSSSVDQPDVLLPGYPLIPLFSQNYRRGLLLEQIEYDKDENIVHKVVNQYKIMEREQPAIMSLRTIKTGLDFPSESSIYKKTFLNYYTTPFGYYRHTSNHEYFYDQHGNVLHRSSRSAFDENIKMLRSESLTNSEGKEETVYHRYSVDQTGGAYDYMKQRFQLNSPVEKITWRRTDASRVKLLQAQKTEYNAINGQFFPTKSLAIVQKDETTPDSVNIPSTRYLPKSHNGKYKKYGQLLEGYTYNDYHMNGLQYAYVWGYHDQHIIAEATNAGADEIYHTSFENRETFTEGDYDNYRYLNFTYLTSKTGKWSYKLENEALVIKPHIPIAGYRDYVLSYWFQPSVGAEWQYKEKIINNYKVGTPITTYVETGFIDELRLHPTDARMVTFTYEPGVGLTSKTDENNITVYFEYDTNHRLKRVRDQDRNIITHHQYHIKTNY